ncbi:hypothetical protein SK128_005259 [Halocaridina rubra]|uniref:Uncharacterized protein n=1 Tax=Halocaridina rubra TaxID=373956 RepID=A0AAN8WDB0_HALRR
MYTWRSWQRRVGERESGIQVIIATVEDLLLLPLMCLHRHVLLQCHPLKEILSLDSLMSLMTAKIHCPSSSAG